MTKKFVTPEQIRLAQYTKALSHPVRVAILQLLANEICCYHGDMSEVLPVAKSTLSQHLNTLKNAGLIQGTITMPTVKYCINKANWAEAQQLTSMFFAQLTPENIE